MRSPADRGEQPQGPERNECATCHRKREKARTAARAAAEGRTVRVVDPERFPCGHSRLTEGRPGKSTCATCHAAREQARYRSDPALHSAKSSAYQKAHRAERNAYHRAWYAANLEHVRAYGRRVARDRKHAKDDPDTLYWIDLIAGDPCGFCGEPTQTVEHIVPRVRGGENHWTNYAGACARCNSAKHARPLLAFMLRQARAADLQASA